MAEVFLIGSCWHDEVDSLAKNGNTDCEGHWIKLGMCFAYLGVAFVWTSNF